MKTLQKTLCSALMASCFAAGGANAALLVDNWDLVLDGATGQGLTGTVSGIDEITYLGIAQAFQQDLGAAGPSIGDTGQVYGGLAATGYTIGGSTGSGFPTGGGLNGGYEMTFTFQVDSILTDVSATTQTQTHLGPTATSGLLTIYIDNLLDGALNGVQANTVSGLGYNDGIAVATFQIIAGGGGSFNFLTLDGTDDATFFLVSALPGVFFKDGIDLSTLIGELLVVTDSNFDADPLTPDLPGVTHTFTQAEPTSVAAFGGESCGAQGINCFWAREDGSASLFQQPIPEPGSLALLGAGLLGLWGARKRHAEA